MSNLKGVVIDAGHGGVDSGAVGNNIKEKDLTLLISLEMYNLLKSYGIPVYLTRDSDITLNPTERVKKALSFFGNGKDVIIISNHINAGGGEGSEVIYALRNNSILANKILDNLSKSGAVIRKSYQKSSTTNPFKDYYFMLRDTDSTESLIVEYGFIDNVKDVNKLKINYKDYAKRVVDSILDYIGYSNVNDYYIVKKGDTLYSIAKNNNTTVDELKKINNINSNIISIGAKLKLPNKSFYVVKKGDTLYSIAKMYNTTVSDLINKNNLTSNLISIGQKIYI